MGDTTKAHPFCFPASEVSMLMCVILMLVENQSKLITEAWLILWLLERCGDALWIVAIAAPSLTLIHRFFPYSP